MTYTTRYLRQGGRVFVEAETLHEALEEIRTQAHDVGQLDIADVIGQLADNLRAGIDAG